MEHEFDSHPDLFSLHLRTCSDPIDGRGVDRVVQWVGFSDANRLDGGSNPTPTIFMFLGLKIVFWPMSGDADAPTTFSPGHHPVN